MCIHLHTLIRYGYMFIILSTMYQISMSALMIMVAVNKCVTTYQAHILVVVMMVFSWMKMNSIVSGISKENFSVLYCQFLN